jgi:hypothetical protein
MSHSTCITLGRIAFFFSVLSPAAFAALVSGAMPGDGAIFAIGLCGLAGLAAFVIGGVSVWGWWLRHRSQPRPAFGGAALLIGALEIGLLVLLSLAWPKC